MRHPATTFLELANEILNCDRQIFLAYDAQQALQLMQHLGGAVALVDLDLQGNDGLWLLQRLREMFPDLPVVAISSVLGVT
jgi:CheY-like chemotaxis protein